MTNVYSLCSGNILLTHGGKQPRLLQDMDDKHEDTKAMAASGDCFITLATQIEDSLRLFLRNEQAADPQFQKIVRTLLYLQRHYKVVPKKADYRQ